MKAALTKPGPVESAQAGARAAAEVLAEAGRGTGNDNALFHRLEAIEAAYGVEGKRAFLRYVARVLAEVCE